MTWPWIVFLAIGLGPCCSGFLLWRAGRQEDDARAERRARHPAEPWMWWRSDWATGIADDETTRWLYQDWLLTSLAVAMAAIMLLVAGPAWNEETNPGRRPWAVAFAIVVSAVALILGARTGSRTMRYSRYGRSVCRFQKIPILPGEVFHATIELPQAPEVKNASVTLECHQVFLQQAENSEGSSRAASGSPGRPAQRIRPALHVERFVAQGAIRTARGIQLPIAVRVPSGVAVEAYRYNPQSSLEWSLDVRTSGGTFARFTLPVFPNDVASK